MQDSHHTDLLTLLDLLWDYFGKNEDPTWVVLALVFIYGNQLEITAFRPLSYSPCTVPLHVSCPTILIPDAQIMDF